MLIMRHVLITIILLAFVIPAQSQQPSTTEGKTVQPEQQQSQSPQHAPATDHVGTERAPITVKVLPAPKTEAEAARDARDREQKAANDQELIKFNRWLLIIGVAQLVIFAGQLAVFGYQALKLRQTVGAAADQSGEMKKSVAESARAAAAMERVAESAAASSKAAIESVANVKEVSSRQMRAYLIANWGAIVEQDSTTNYRFEPRMLLFNTGFTPGYEVSYRAHADVLSFPLPDDFDFPMPDLPLGSASTLGHGQSFIMAAVVDRLYSDAEISEIKSGKKKRLYIYGTANYKDAFGVNRYTNFCQSVLWLKGGSSMGVYTRRHNDAN